MNDSLRYALALLRVPHLNNAAILQLLNLFSPKEIFKESQNPHSEVFKGKVQECFLAVDWKMVDEDLRWLESPWNHFISIKDEDYPSLLRDIANPPAFLFIKGQRDLLSKHQLAIVGSRSSGKLGVQMAQDFASALVKEGLTITSGLSLGIDAAAHKGALEAGGSTIAVAGTSLDRVYPAKHKDLATSIYQQGAIISEYPLGMAADGKNFPARNRIISGLSLGVLVVEAEANCGSVGIAQSALDQNREVFAIPGSIHNPLAKGCNILIRQGAKLVDSAEDVMEDLDNMYQIRKDRFSPALG